MQLHQWKRREFITLLGGAAAAWPLAARAQEPMMPVVGYLNLESPGSASLQLANLKRGLNQAGYFEGRDFVIEYRWARNQADRLPALVADLVQLRAAVIIAVGSPSALAAKAVTTSIPIVFVVANDPVQLGLVASLNRPGSNLTGFNVLNAELGGKMLALLHELMPNIATIGFLENPNSPVSELTTRDVLTAAPVIGLKVQILKASTDREIDDTFASLVQTRVEALLVGGDPLFNNRMERLIELSARYAIPTMYGLREFVVEGGLISYGTSLIETYRQIGLYAGRILKGEKPVNLPVIQATKFELVINLKTAKALGLDVPSSLLVRADEVIE